MLKRTLLTSIAALTLTWSATSHAGVDKSLPYPSGTPTANAIAEQVYFVNHFFALKNFSIDRDGDTITVIASRSVGEKPLTNTVERHLNNEYAPGDEVKSKDLAIFRSGKLQGTGMLIVDYSDDSKSQSYSIWLPALRKIRRFAQPAHDDAWGGTDFTFGDVTLRKPQHETHELLGKETFGECLMAMELTEDQRNKYTKDLHGSFCGSKGRPVYKLKSATKFENWWYDYRISYVDTETFGDFRTEYFKNGEKIKIIDRAWDSLGLPDKRALKWRYWYGKNLTTNHETMASIPDSVVKFNGNKEENFWSETTLSKINR